jgi:hypothetical protein
VVAASVGFRGLGRAVGYASASFLGAAGLVEAVKAGFNEMFEGQKVAAQTAAALKSTGQVAGVTAQQIGTLAGSLQKLTGYDDEAIQSAENLLLTFTNVRNVAGQGNDIFNQATEATLNLSRTFDQDLSASAVQLGKALNDPVRGVTALRRVGVSFTEQQVNLIKRLTETGHVLDAQKIILQELNRETGNSARAYGKTLPGQLDILRGNLENLSGDLAKTLNPELKKLADRFNKWLEDPKHKKEIIDGFSAGVNALGDAANFAAGTVDKLKKAWDALPDFGKHKGLIDLLPGGRFSGLDLLHALGIGGGPQPGKFVPGKGTGPKYTVTRPPAPPTATGAAAPGTVPTPKPPRGITAQQRNAWFDAMIGRKLDRVQDIGTLRGQIKQLEQIRGLIQGRIDVTKDITRKLTLGDQIAEINRRVADDEAQIATDAAAAQQAAADKAAAAAKKLAEAEKKRQEALKKATAERVRSFNDLKQFIRDQDKERKEIRQKAAARETQLEQEKIFGILGLTKTGEERAPGRGALLAMITKAQKAVAGTPQDTKALETRLTNLRRVINTEFSKLTRDTKMRVAEWLDALSGKDETAKKKELVQTFYSGGRLVHYRPGQQTTLEQAMGSENYKNYLKFGVAGLPRTFGVGGAARGFVGGVTINGGLHLHGVQDVRGLENELTRRGQQRPQTRRGPV